jgi:hypothetical protein
MAKQEAEQSAKDTFTGAPVDVAKAAPMSPPQDAEKRAPVTQNDK